MIGDNGSGKSLLAEALRGMLPLTAGEMRWERADSLESATQGVGLVSFESRHAVLNGTVVQSRWNSLESDATMPVLDFLSYEHVMEVNPFEVTHVHAVAKPVYELRKRQAVALFRLGRLIERSMVALSNGEHQRVQLARAWCRSSTMLILDEPFQGLDIAARAELRAILERIIRSPLPVLILTTRWDELPDRVTHLLQVENCRIENAGPKPEVLEHLQKVRARSTASWSVGWVPSGGSRRASPFAESIVELQNVTVRYDAKCVLRNLSWTVRQFESWALLGPNGSGKSTLLSLLLGDHPQSYSNKVRVFGQPRGNGQSIWDLKRRIGWVSPELQLHFPADVTSFDVVVSGFTETAGVFERPSRKQRQAAVKWLSMVGFADRAEDAFATFSEGEQRLLLLARALVKSPKLLLLDEPCQGLDSKGRDHVTAMIQSMLSKRSFTTIYVTHREAEIPAVVRKVLRLKSGRGFVEDRDSKESIHEVGLLFPQSSIRNPVR